MENVKLDFREKVFDLKYSIGELKRMGGCVPMSYEVEDNAVEILTKLNYDKYSILDILKVIAYSCVDTRYFSAVPDANELLALLRKELNLEKS